MAISVFVRPSFDWLGIKKLIIQVPIKNHSNIPKILGRLKNELTQT